MSGCTSTRVTKSAFAAQTAQSEHLLVPGADLRTGVISVFHSPSTFWGWAKAQHVPSHQAAFPSVARPDPLSGYLTRNPKRPFNSSFNCVFNLQAEYSDQRQDSWNLVLSALALLEQSSPAIYTSEEIKFLKTPVPVWMFYMMKITSLSVIRHNIVEVEHKDYTTQTTWPRGWTD